MKYALLSVTVKCGCLIEVILLLGTCCCINHEINVFQTGITLSEWVQELPLFNPDAAGISLSSKEMLELKYYKVM